MKNNQSSPLPMTTTNQPDKTVNQALQKAISYFEGRYIGPTAENLVGELKAAQLKSDLQQEISARNGWWDNCKKAEQERESMQRQLGEKDRVLAQNEKVIEKLRLIADALKGDTADEVVAITNSLFDTEAERDSLQSQVDGLTSWMELIKGSIDAAVYEGVIAGDELGTRQEVYTRRIQYALDQSPAASLQAHDAKLQLERDALAKALLAAYDTMGLPPGCTIEPSIAKAIEDYKFSLAAHDEAQPKPEGSNENT